MEKVAEMRALLCQLFDVAVEAAEPSRAVSSALRALGYGRATGQTLIIAVGKAAPAMMRAALPMVDGAVTAICVTQHGNPADLPGVEVHHTGHPVPDEAGARAGARVAALLQGLGPDDRVLALVSGGGSALLPAPAEGLTLADKAAVNRLLLESGLDIVAMNLIRQQLSRLKGGGMLRLAAPAPVTALILSDVVGDDLRAIASGPTASPLGTAAEARRLMQDTGIWDRAPAAVRSHLSRDVPPPTTPDARNILVGSNRQSVDAMARAVPEGWAIVADPEPLTGDVADAATRIVASARGITGPTALLFGGETTVRLTGTGSGGRNQELALRIALGPALPGAWAFLSAGTDGRDGPTEAAGGIVDAASAARMRASGVDPVALLTNNDSNAALAASGDLLTCGATGTNVADVQALLIRP